MKRNIKWGILWTLAHLPGGKLLYDRMLRSGGELARLESSSRFDNAFDLVRRARQHLARPWPEMEVVELGTGWVPAIPLAFALCGCRVRTFDVQHLTDPDLFARTRAELSRRLSDLALAAESDIAPLQDRLQEIESARTLDAALRRMNGEYLAPCDTSRLPIRDATVDLVVTGLVLQCVPLVQLPDVLEESHRVLTPDGIAIHRVRMTDEYSQDDPACSPIDFLRYSRPAWDRWFNHRLKHQNRLRASEFMALFRQAGFDCLDRDELVSNDCLRHLDTLPLHADYAHSDRRDLATVGMTVVLRKSSASDSCLTTQPAVVRPDETVPALTTDLALTGRLR